MDDITISGLPIDAVIKKPTIDLTDGVSSTSSSSGSSDDSGSLKKAEAKGAEKQREMAGVPILPPPHQLVDYDFSIQNILAPISSNSQILTPKEADILINTMMNQAVTKILTAWIDGLQNDAQYQKIATNLREQKERVQDTIQQSQKLQNTNKDSSKESAQHAATYGLLVSAGMLALGLGTNVNPVGLASLNTIKEVGQVVSAIAPTAVDKVLTSLVTAFGGGLITQAGLMTLKNSSHNKEKYNYEFAKNYSVRTLSIVNGNEIDQAVATVFATGSDDLISSKTTLVKVALLTQSLAFAYHLETGSLSGMELAGMLQGKIVFDKDDFRNPLVSTLNAELAQLPPPNRAIVVEKLMAYFDSKPDLNELAEPANAIRSLFGPITAVSLPIAG